MQSEGIPYGHCQCGCGQKAPIAKRSKSAKGHVKGQPVRFVAGHQSRRHGHSGRGGLAHTPTYRSWRAMLTRCTNPNATSYESYGGCGVVVCERWHAFENFLADMGERPPGTTLDRIDNDGNYEPGNCRWATPQEQTANRRIPNHCPHGHEYTPENTSVNSRGARHCKACARERAAEKRRVARVERLHAAIARGATRPQRIAQAQALRSEGLTLRQIGERMGGLAESTVCEMLRRT